VKQRHRELLRQLEEESSKAASLALSGYLCTVIIGVALSALVRKHDELEARVEQLEARIEQLHAETTEART